MAADDATQRRPRRPFSERRFNSLSEIIKRYVRESRICAKNRVYYAACITLGAALEGALLAMCDLQFGEVELLLASLPSNERPRGPVDRWGMDDLLKVATRLGWLPARAHEKARRRVGDWSHLVKELRNLAHPGRHIRDYPDVRLRKAHYDDARWVYGAAIEWLEHHNSKRLIEAMEKKGIPLKA